jgi:hypothetical protein
VENASNRLAKVQLYLKTVLRLKKLQIPGFEPIPEDKHAIIDLDLNI